MRIPHHSLSSAFRRHPSSLLPTELLCDQLRVPFQPSQLPPTKYFRHSALLLVPGICHALHALLSLHMLFSLLEMPFPPGPPINYPFNSPQLKYPHFSFTFLTCSSLIHSQFYLSHSPFHKCLWNVYYMSDTVPCARDSAVTKQRVPASWRMQPGWGDRPYPLSQTNAKLQGLGGIQRSGGQGSGHTLRAAHSRPPPTNSSLTWVRPQPVLSPDSQGRQEARPQPGLNRNVETPLIEGRRPSHFPPHLKITFVLKKKKS